MERQTRQSSRDRALKLMPRLLLMRMVLSSSTWLATMLPSSSTSSCWRDEGHRGEVAQDQQTQVHARCKDVGVVTIMLSLKAGG